MNVALTVTLIWTVLAVAAVLAIHTCRCVTAQRARRARHAQLRRADRYQGEIPPGPCGAAGCPNPAAGTSLCIDHTLALVWTLELAAALQLDDDTLTATFADLLDHIAPRLQGHLSIDLGGFDREHPGRPAAQPPHQPGQAA